LQKKEDSGPLTNGNKEMLTSGKSSGSEVEAGAEATEVPSTNILTSAAQRADRDRPSELCTEKELCQWVMAKANSLNEVNGRDLDTVDCARVSLDAESGPMANRRRRKRYSPGRKNTPQVSMD